MQRDCLESFSSAILGDRAFRENSGGVAKFEKSDLAQKVKDSDRAYSTGAMVQQQRMTEAPAAALKVIGGSLTPEQESLKAFIAVSTLLFLRHIFFVHHGIGHCFPSHEDLDSQCTRQIARVPEALWRSSQHASHRYPRELHVAQLANEHLPSDV